MSLISLVSLTLLWVPLCADDRAFPDKALTVENVSGEFTVQSIKVRKGGLRPTRLDAILVNNTKKDFTDVWLRVRPKDGVGTQFNAAAPFSLGAMKAGDRKPFFYTLTGRFDFASLDYDIEIHRVTAPSRYVFTMGESGSTDLSVVGSEFSFRFYPGDTGIAFEVENHSTSADRIDWNQMAYIDIDGQSHKVMGEGMRYTDRNAVHPPTVIPPGAKVKQIMIPTDNVLWLNRDWHTLPLLPVCPACTKMIGKTIRVYMLIEHLGKPIDFSFAFPIKSVD